jgi:hypothetical protein
VATTSRRPDTRRRSTERVEGVRNHALHQFPDRPEDVIAYFMFVAERVREQIAMLGARTLDERAPKSRRRPFVCALMITARS